MRMSKRLALLAIVTLSAVSLSLMLWPESDSRHVPPAEWPQKSAFCAEAALLGVGEPELSGVEHARVLRVLAATAPGELKRELASIRDAAIHSHDDLDEEMVERVGRFIQDRCQVNLPGVTAGE